jgi:hypothetical protein
MCLTETGIRRFFLALSGTLVLASCGLPDIIPQITKPTVTSLTSVSYTIGSTGDLKANGDSYGIYGLDVYYKIYKRSDAKEKFEADWQAVASLNGSEPRNILNQKNFMHLAVSSKEEETNKISPVCAFSDSGAWSLTFELSTGYKKTVDVYAGTSTTAADPMFRFYRLVPENPAEKYKGFSSAALAVNQDQDLVQYRQDNSFNGADASFGIIMFVFAQDVDWGFLPLFSAPVRIGPFDIN